MYFFNENKKVPTHGYMLTLWGDGYSYRATAIAYMKREGLKQVTNKNGKNYFLNELEEATL